MTRLILLLIPCSVTIVSAGCGDLTESESTTPSTTVTAPDDGPEIVTESATSATVDDSIYSVAEYDPEGKAEVDLVTTVAMASSSQKRILLEIGGHW